MSYYLRVLPDKASLHAWKVESHVAFRIGVPNPEQLPEAYFKARLERQSGKLFGVKRVGLSPQVTILFTRLGFSRANTIRE
jgi:hypothetical protein